MLSDREQRQLLRNTRITANNVRMPAYIGIVCVFLVIVVPLLLGLLAVVLDFLFGLFRPFV